MKSRRGGHYTDRGVLTSTRSVQICDLKNHYEVKNTIFTLNILVVEYIVTEPLLCARPVLMWRF